MASNDRIHRRLLRRRDAGMTLLEVTVAFMIMAICILPILISLGHARRTVTTGQIKRTMKQLVEYKMSNILLDRPSEDQEPIYVDGAEGNFGEEFANDPNKAYFFDEKYYFYSYRIDSEEVDLGASGGITGEEEETAQPEPPQDPAGSPFGDLGEGGTEEELGQIRYKVTLTVFYRTGNARFDQSMSVVTYVRHPHDSEAMTGPELQAGQQGIGGNQATGGAGNGGTTGSNQAGARTNSSISTIGGSSRDTGDRR